MKIKHITNNKYAFYFKLSNSFDIINEGDICIEIDKNERIISNMGIIIKILEKIGFLKNLSILDFELLKHEKYYFKYKITTESKSQKHLKNYFIVEIINYQKLKNKIKG